MTNPQKYFYKSRHNRPLDQGHVRDIAEYLRSASEYLVPPIILNAAQPLQTFVYRGSAARDRACLCCRLKSTYTLRMASTGWKLSGKL